MTTLSPTFLVFDSTAGPKSEDAGLTYCSSKDTNVQWPKLAQRGRPRKDPKEHGCSMKYPPRVAERASKERYKFVDYSHGPRPNDPNARKFVRTHVMHSHQRQKQKAAHTKLGLQETGTESQDNDTDATVEPERALSLSPERWSKDPFDSFPIQMQPYMHNLLHLYVSAFADHLYPIEVYWGFNPAKKFWAPLALTDPAILHSIMFVGDQIGARIKGQKERPSAIDHLKQTIRILNERLHEPLQEISDSTVAAVAAVALTEQSSGNQANWRIHMSGIKRMVEMRGGLSAFECNPIMHEKLCRADLCGSIPDLSKPYLQMENIKVQPIVLPGYDETETTLAPGFQAVHYDYGFNSGLLDILYKIHTVTQNINTLNPSKSETIPLRLRQRIRSVQYYLLSTENYDDTSGSGDQLLEACRLGILLYVGIILNDFWVSPISKQFIWRLKSCLQSKSFATDAMHALRLWLMFLAGSLVLDPTEKLWFVCSIVQTVSQISLSNWCNAKSLLETFAWVGKVQDKSGQDLWDEAMRMQCVF